MNDAKSPYSGYRYPAEIIGHAVWLHFRFTPSCRDVADLLAARGVIVTRETVRRRCLKFGQDFANWLYARHPDEATSGIWTRFISVSTAGATACGGPWIRTATRRISRFSRSATSALPSASFSRARARRRGLRINRSSLDSSSGGWRRHDRAEIGGRVDVRDDAGILAGQPPHPIGVVAQDRPGAFISSQLD